ncbi:hypothetical protein HQ42_07460 [Porphyromonas gulae]|uniref:GLPGLI family protein n=1 Tax=Porphyromonas gulae TaxID=111105 RepID=UPI00052C730C|nr:GLPGLI family protein [Porphyromonas gulae]KGO02307.1 hypothetical protein HQ42_07460 [Porphyromonas gulae]
MRYCQIYFCLFILTLKISSSFSQEIFIEGFKTDTLEKDFLDKCVLRVYYDTFIKLDTLDKNNKRGITMLQIGERTCKFVDFFQHYTDSLRDEIARIKRRQVIPSEVVGFQYSLFSKIVFRNQVFRDYSSSGGCNVVRLGSELGEFYSYQESRLEFHWDTSFEEEKILAGYKCRKAVCVYRGRVYTAWFSPDLSYRLGPYVFGGLPGLILEIGDAEGEFIFSLRAIIPGRGREDPIFWVRSSYETFMDKEQAWRQIVERHRNILFEIDEGKFLKEEIPYNPIERY